MEIDNEILASRYARAHLNYVACSKDLNFAVRLGSFATFLDLYKHRLIQVDATFYEMLGNIFSLDNCRIGLIARLLSRQGRLVLMPSVMRYFFEYYKRKYMLAFCKIEVSHELSDDQKEFLANFIVRASGKEIVFSVKVDRSLIAGIRIEGDEMLWESSVARQLRVIEQLQ